MVSWRIRFDSERENSKSCRCVGTPRALTPIAQIKRMQSRASDKAIGAVDEVLTGR